MQQTAIFGPFFATMLLTVLVWVYMFVVRVRFFDEQGIRPADLATPGELARISPAHVSNPSDNFKNLFEIPVLFYALALYLFATQQVDAVYVWTGWIFAAFRALHSLTHCTINVVIVRFYLYLVSTLAVFFMLGRAAFVHFGA